MSNDLTAEITRLTDQSRLGHGPMLNDLYARLSALVAEAKRRPGAVPARVVADAERALAAPRFAWSRYTSPPAA